MSRGPERRPLGLIDERADTEVIREAARRVVGHDHPVEDHRAVIVGDVPRHVGVAPLEAARVRRLVREGVGLRHAPVGVVAHPQRHRP